MCAWNRNLRKIRSPLVILSRYLPHYYYHYLQWLLLLLLLLRRLSLFVRCCFIPKIIGVYDHLSDLCVYVKTANTMMTTKSDEYDERVSTTHSIRACGMCIVIWLVNASKMVSMCVRAHQPRRFHFNMIFVYYYGYSLFITIINLYWLALCDADDDFVHLLPMYSLLLFLLDSFVDAIEIKRKMDNKWYLWYYYTCIWINFIIILRWWWWWWHISSHIAHALKHLMDGCESFSDSTHSYMFLFWTQWQLIDANRIWKGDSGRVCSPTKLIAWFLLDTELWVAKLTIESQQVHGRYFFKTQFIYIYAKVSTKISKKNIQTFEPLIIILVI